MDRDVLARLREAPVDTAHHLFDLGAQLPVLADVTATRHGDLDEGDLAAQVASVLEEQLDRAQAFDDPLRVVEAVDSHEDAPPGELSPQPVEIALDGLRLRLRAEPVGVDRDRMGRRQDRSPVGQAQHCTVRRCVRPQPQARSEEVLPVLLGLKGHDIGPEQTLEQAVTPG